ncbi:MAG: hypothetical protein HUJ61_08810, partial [Bacilli bacterium]|nr:hypothetical protein [Bacilli bacterium]
ERILSFKEDVDKVCENADKKLKEYYATADLSKIELDNKKEEKSNEKTKAIVNIISQEGDILEDAKTYLMKIIPILAFFVFGILSIPGWIICCFCCCCNCCCCCCCKKGCCRFPMFIVTLAFNAVVIISCIYGLSQSNNVFVGLANTECALLKFIGEIQEGETRKEIPRWIGFDGIKGLFDNIKTKIGEMQNQTDIKLNDTKNAADDKKVALDAQIRNTCSNVKDSSHIITVGLNIDVVPPGNTNDELWLSIYELYGNCQEGDSREGTFTYLFDLEYKTVANESSQYLDQAKNNFGELLNNKNDINKVLGEAEDSIKEIESPINDLKDSLAGTITEYSDLIENYGKKGFKAVFSVLTIL